MKKKNHTIKALLLISVIALVLTSCSRITRATDFITQPTAKEVYKREFTENPDLFALWEDEGQKALGDKVAVNLPYAESGMFLPRSFPAYSYDVALNPGEKLALEIETDTLGTLVFIDLYQEKKDSIQSFEHIGSADLRASAYRKEISEPGIYKIVVQPELEAYTPFRLKMHKESVYIFPVASRSNSAIQSFWGATRDGGRRSHEGIDIFAPRGTPVVAAVKGRVTSTGNKGLGGKQVWLRDSKRGNSLYYAHLDSIATRTGMTVAAGDTLGFVGNTGNARTTAPHLHFGIYKGYRGAVNPLHFVYENEKPETADFPAHLYSDNVLVTRTTANLRTGPSTKAGILKQAQPKDTLRVLGKTSGWYHIRTNEENSFIHESLVAPI